MSFTCFYKENATRFFYNKTKWEHRALSEFLPQVCSIFIFLGVHIPLHWICVSSFKSYEVGIVATCDFNTMAEMYPCKKKAVRIIRSLVGFAQVVWLHSH